LENNRKISLQSQKLLSSNGQLERINCAVSAIKKLTRYCLFTLLSCAYYRQVSICLVQSSFPSIDYWPSFIQLQAFKCSRRRTFCHRFVPNIITMCQCSVNICNVAVFWLLIVHHYLDLATWTMCIYNFYWNLPFHSKFEDFYH